MNRSGDTEGKRRSPNRAWWLALWAVVVGSLIFRMAARSAILLEAAWALAPTSVPTRTGVGLSSPPTPLPTIPFTATSLPTGTPLPTSTPPPTRTGDGRSSPPTATPLPGPTATFPASPTPLPSPTAPPTPVVRIDPNCALSTSEEGLLTFVDKQHGLGREYVPPELVPLDLMPRNTYVLPVYLRAQAVQPLLDMLNAMNAGGLRPKVISGYRSYVEQALAYQQWLNFDPQRGPQISAPAGFSEHQLGTVVDFGSPALEYRFHTNFYFTPEGQWLDQRAAGYGWTLTYPAWAVEQTGFEWEPWHYRFVGKALAAELRDRQLTLSAYLRGCLPNG